MWGNLNRIMPDRKWHFRKVTSLEQLTFNDALRRFSSEGVNSIVRENIQNSLDNRLYDNNEPVKVVIKTGTLRPENLPGIKEVYEHISSLKAFNKYTDLVVRQMQETICQESVPYISFEDFNSKGLTGAFHGERANENDTWNMYAYKKGVHYHDDNSSVENSKCGVLGLGKIANNAASNIHTMYFSNCDENGSKYIGGTVELIDHEFAGRKYSSTGYFARVEDDKCYPFVNEFDSVFAKSTRGLKVIVPFLKKTYNDTFTIIRAVCDNFFVAICKEQLEVELNGTIINKDSIKTLIKDEKVCSRSDYREGNRTELYIETYLKNEVKDFTLKEKRLDDTKFDLYVSSGDGIRYSSVALVRKMGTKVEDKQILDLSKDAFNGVLIPRDANADLFLKNIVTEPLSDEFRRDKNIFEDQLKECISRYIDRDNFITKLFGDAQALRIVDEDDLNYNSEVNTEIKSEDKIEVESEIKPENLIIKDHKKKNISSKTYKGSYEMHKKDELDKFSDWLRKNSFTEKAIEKYINQGNIIDLYCKQHYGVYFLEPKNIKELYTLREKLSKVFTQEKSEIFMKNYYQYKANGN